MIFSTDVLGQALSLLNKPKSIPFLTEDFTVAEVRFASPISAAECRNNPASTIAKHGFLKMLTDQNEVTTALMALEEQT